MNPVRNVVAAALVAAGASAAGAQARCETRENQPNELRAVQLAVIQSDAMQGAENLGPVLNALRQLNENAAKIDAKNAVGRQWQTGRLYYNLARVLPTGTVVTRGQVGLDDPTANIDPIAMAVTALDAVEAAGCREQVAPYRTNLFAIAYGAAVRAYGAENLEMAQAHLDRARALNPSSPDLYNVQAAIAQKKGDNRAMLAAYRRVLELASPTDTAYRELRETATQNIGIIAVNEAESASPEEKRALLTEAITVANTALAANRCDLTAFTVLSRASMAMGDTARVKRGYEELANNTDCTFTDAQLFDAGANAAILNQNVAAKMLLVRGLQQNPFYRDALFNIANIYWTEEKVDSLTMFASRLVAVDPDNPDNWRMLAAAEQIRLKGITDPARKRAVTDSLVKLAAVFTNMPVKVAFTEWRNTDGRATLAGTVENRVNEEPPARRPAARAGTAAARRPAAPPPAASTTPTCAKPNATYALTFEFLDRQGNVVTTQTANVGPLACGATAPFRVQAEGQGIAAFRYKSVR